MRYQQFDYRRLGFSRRPSARNRIDSFGDKNLWNTVARYRSSKRPLRCRQLSGIYMLYHVRYGLF